MSGIGKHVLRVKFRLIIRTVLQLSRFVKVFVVKHMNLKQLEM